MRRVARRRLLLLSITFNVLQFSSSRLLSLLNLAPPSIMHFTTLLASVIVGFSALSAAHPGEHHEERSQESAAQLREFKANTHRSLEGCAEKLKRDGVHERAIARRQAVVDKHTKRRVTRDTATVLNTSHHSNSSVNELSPETSIFETSGTCVLNPEGEVGPVSCSNSCFHYVTECQFLF